MNIVLHRDKQISPRNYCGFNRQEWRNLAMNLGVKRGRNTMDTVANIKQWVADQKRKGIVITADWAKHLRAQGLDL